MSSCINCGKQVDPEDKFCIHCGKPIEKEARAAQEAKKDVTPTIPLIQDVEKPKPHVGQQKTQIYSQPLAVSERSTNKTAVVLLSVFLALSVIGAGVIGFFFMDKSNEYTMISEDLIQANQDIFYLILAETESQNDISYLSNQVSDLTSERNSIQGELDDMNAVFPPSHFSSVVALENWLKRNPISEEPRPEYADETYTQGLRLQEDALKDGYTISVAVREVATPGFYIVYCLAVAEGRLVTWFVDSDEVFEWPFDYEVWGD